MIRSQGQKNRWNFEIAITRSILIVQRGNRYWHNLWLTGHLSKALKFRFWFRFECQQASKIETVSQLYFSYTIASIWLQIWNLRGKLCPIQHFLCLLRHRLLHRRIETLSLYKNLRFTPGMFQLRRHMREPNPIRYLMAPDISYNENFFLNFYLQNWLRYRFLKFKFCLLRSAIIF